DVVGVLIDQLGAGLDGGLRILGADAGERVVGVCRGEDEKGQGYQSQDRQRRMQKRHVRAHLLASFETTRHFVQYRFIIVTKQSMTMRRLTRAMPNRTLKCRSDGPTSGDVSYV